MAVAVMIGLVSCGEGTDKKDKEIATKVVNHEALTPEDYSRIIKYVGEYAEKAQKYVDMKINGTDDGTADKELAALNAEYPYVDAFRGCLRQTSVSQLSEKDMELVHKYAGLIEFTAPADYNIETMPAQEAGVEMETPDTTNGVVAGAVDEVKQEMKGF